MTYPLRFRKFSTTVAANGSFTPDASDYGYFAIDYQGGPGTTFTLNAPINIEPGQSVLFDVAFSGLTGSGPPSGTFCTFTYWGGSGNHYGSSDRMVYTVAPTAPTYMLDGIDWYTHGLPIP